MKMNNLVAHTIPLVGKHLIEASAGTGKTYNITRIYLRLLLEERIGVEQILVMTFTKDATEELRGRIDAFIREALNNWSTLIQADEYFKAIAQNMLAKGWDENEARILLKQALLFLDEAAIYTIHGFCKRVLNQHAFASGLSFNAAMESNCQDIVLESCQDWYRVLAQQSSEQFLLLAEFWPTPNHYLSQFAKALSRDNSLDVVDEHIIKEAFLLLVQTAITILESNNHTLVSALVDVKKGQDREKRAQELTDIITWLNAVLIDIDVAKTKMPDAFIDGRRYAKSAYKAELNSIFEPVKEVVKLVKTLTKTINKARAFSIVRDGIYHIRADVADKKKNLDMLSFDDLISTLANALKKERNNDTAGELASLLFKQYPVALVDEFQDTDPQQFSILQAIYYHQPTAALYMIGDPKQAIYGFRGGDVFAYLSARQGCDHQWLMDTNWRSSDKMINGYNRLFYGNNLSGNSRDVFGYNIPYIPVNSSPVAVNKQFDCQEFKALQFVHFIPEEQKGFVKQSYRGIMATWCANEIARLLSAIPLNLNAQNIAILVRDGTEAATIKQALESKGLASVFMSNRANLLQSAQTKQLLQVLKGILFVENERLYCAALASDLLGFSPDKLYQKQQDEFSWQELKFSFYSLREQWQHKGFIGMALKLMHEHFTLAKQDKDRVLTNLLHLFELLQAASQRHRQPQELLYWFEQQSKQDNPELEAELRLESDDNLIRIITQHGAKGLEYPIVFVPFVTRFKDPLKFGKKNVDFIEYHDDNGTLQLSLDGSLKAKQAMADEAFAEAIRLLYVAVTRSEQRCYLLTVEFENYCYSPLGRTLKWQKDENIITSISNLVADDPDAIGLLQVTDSAEESNSVQVNEQHILTNVAQFKGKIERDWWLSSFTALSKNLRHGGVSSPDRDSDSENNNLNINSINELEQDNDYLDSSLLRFNLAKGAHTGNLLHDILEHSNFCSPDWATTMKLPLTKYGELSGYKQTDLEYWLQQVLQAPLTNNQVNVEATAFSLKDISLSKSLRESEFYFPMETANSQQLAKLLTDHRNTGISNTEFYKTPVRLPTYQKLKGMMHGFIDLIFEHDNRYYVADYKSTHLGDHFHAYNQDAIQANIEINHYDLQYLIYSLALHRHLAYLLPNYDPHCHFGGIYYLYLRGMTDDKKHQGAGVYHRKISISELNKLDAIFKGEIIDA